MGSDSNTMTSRPETFQPGGIAIFGRRWDAAKMGPLGEGDAARHAR
jgi:hypothetical protein